MRTSYGQLIRDHDLIENTANALLSNLNNPSVGSAPLAAQLHELASIVEAHIEVEEGIVSGFDRGRLIGPWSLAWDEGLTAFERLRTDWVAFLGRWNADAIKADTGSFRDAARTILGRLRERVQLETQAFYATALQTGAIELR